MIRVPYHIGDPKKRDHNLENYPCARKDSRLVNQLRSEQALASKPEEEGMQRGSPVKHRELDSSDKPYHEYSESSRPLIREYTLK